MYVTACVPIQTYANYHMITELAEPRIGINVSRSLPPFGGGVWGQDYYLPCACARLNMEILTEYTLVKESELKEST